MSRRISFFLLAFVIIGCTSNRQGPTTRLELAEKSEDVEPWQGVPLDAAPEPEYVARERQHSIDLAVDGAEALFQRGKQLFESTQFDEARSYFEECLRLLEESGFSFVEAPEIDIAYYRFSSEIQRMEMRLLVEADEPPLPEEFLLSESPLDEIGALDLYAIEVDPALEDLVSEDLKNTQFNFPVMVNQQVLRFLDYYQGRGRKSMEEALRRSGRYIDKFREIFAEEGLPTDLIYMAHVESLFKPRAYSRARARGIWQFVAGTARLYDLKVGWWLDERLDVYKATRSAARHLRDLNEEFSDWYLALAAYNGGPGRVRRPLRRHGKMDYWTMAKRRLLPRETRNYVPSILAAIIVYRHPEKYGFSVEPEPPLDYETISLEHQFDLGVIAESIGVSQKTVADLNPALLRGVTPFNPEGFRLKIPVGTGDLLTRKLAEIPPEKRLRLKHHKVRQGETLSHIAARYGVSIRGIAEVNRIRNVNRLKLGQDLIIPLSWGKGTPGSSYGGSGAEMHIVQRGDSLYRIARLYGVKLNDLFRWNNLNAGDVIHPGQEIRLSAVSAE